MDQTLSHSTEIRLTRIYEVPLQKVWEAWTDPLKQAKWWGPRGFTITHHSKDLRSGGHWKYTMHGPDGVDYPNHTSYLEVIPFKCLVYDHGGNDDQPPLFRVTVQFTAYNGKTVMKMSMALPSSEMAAATRLMIKKAHGDSTWDRLAEFLIKESTGQDCFVINRSFKGSIDALYQAWTNPSHLFQWMGPSGSKVQCLRADIRDGGSLFYSLQSNESPKMYGRAVYIKLEKNSNIVYTQEFVDQDENVSCHPMSPNWPKTMLTTVTFAEENPANTRINLVWKPYGQVSKQSLQTFIDSRMGMMLGWTGSFDRLDECL